MNVEGEAGARFAVHVEGQIGAGGLQGLGLIGELGKRRDKTAEAAGLDLLQGIEVGLVLRHGQQDHAQGVRRGPDPFPEIRVGGVAVNHAALDATVFGHLVGVALDTDDHGAVAVAQNLVGAAADAAHAEDGDLRRADVERPVLGMPGLGLESAEGALQFRIEAVGAGIEGRGQEERDREGNRDDRQPARIDPAVGGAHGPDDQTELAVGRQTERGQQEGPCPQAETSQQDPEQQRFQRQEQDQEDADGDLFERRHSGQADL